MAVDTNAAGHRAPDLPGAPASRSPRRIAGAIARRNGAGREYRALADFIGESGIYAGAGATVIYQLALYGVGKGVAEHSTTTDRPLDRLRTTMQYVYAVSLGTEEEKRKIVRLVNKAHVPVRSERHGYTAFDPELQLWVGATLVRNTRWFRDWIWGPENAAAEENLYREAQIFGNALQVKEEMWPGDFESFEEYWDDMLDNRISTDPEIVRYVHRLVGGRDAPWPVRLLMPLNAFITTGILDRRVRDLFELPWSPVDERRFRLLMKTVAFVYRLVPAPLRTVPARLYMADLRRRFKGGKHVI
ncbi:oxygenase MpaB family protein [Corynebacterium hansenii]|uniref:Oxygenase MpaB family protein n=1 Tax=Corynebacterium hansenii TaxID=394964 RepID=A0ABV7ZQ08_9CORY|nr:oxygenase MpaB family protein [Corynebacterium hansenii]WJZ00435.1 hypothetical protein CHAN_09140 [Corynebacterium hansenii]